MKRNKPQTILFELLNGNPETYILASRDTPQRRLVVVDEKGQRQRPIRYCSNIETPYVDEQIKQMGTDGVFNIEHVMFMEGNLNVDAYNKALINFLDVHPGNEKNGGNVFRKYDPEREAQEEMEELDLQFKAETLARESTMDVLMGIVRQLTGFDVDNMSDFEIKRAAINHARDYPENFLQVADNPEFEVKNIAHMAVDHGYMHFRKEGGEIWHSFPDNKTKLAVIPVGEDPYDWFTRYLKSKEGHELLLTLKKLMEIK